MLFFDHGQYGKILHYLLLRALSVSACFGVSGNCEGMGYSEKTVWRTLASLQWSVMNLFFFCHKKQKASSSWLENTISSPSAHLASFGVSKTSNPELLSLTRRAEVSPGILHLLTLLPCIDSVSGRPLQGGPPWPTSSQLSNPKGQRVAFPNNSSTHPEALTSPAKITRSSLNQSQMPRHGICWLTAWIICPA